MAETAELSSQPQPKARKIDRQFVLELCQLVAKRINETAACSMLNVNHRAWFRWKERKKNQRKFDALLLRVRETKLNSLLESIDDAGTSETIADSTGKVHVLRRADWRAHAWLAERVIAPERLGQVNGSSTTTNTQIVVNVGGEDAVLKIMQAAYARVEQERRLALPPAGGVSGEEAGQQAALP